MGNHGSNSNLKLPPAPQVADICMRQSSPRAMQLEVYLVSGASCRVQLSPQSPVRELKAKAQWLLKRRFLALMFRQQKLDPWSALSEVGVRDGDIIDAIVQPVALASTTGAFALHATGGSVLTWGLSEKGGDTSQVREQLTRIQHIQATARAFAAILGDGFVTTWGDPTSGGDSSDVQEQLVRVQQVQATLRAFAAILDDGSVVTWGNPDFGGDSSQVQGQLARVQRIQATCWPGR